MVQFYCTLPQFSISSSYSATPYLVISFSYLFKRNNALDLQYSALHFSDLHFHALYYIKLRNKYSICEDLVIIESFVFICNVGTKSSQKIKQLSDIMHIYVELLM